MIWSAIFVLSLGAYLFKIVGAMVGARREKSKEIESVLPELPLENPDKPKELLSLPTINNFEVIQFSKEFGDYGINVNFAEVNLPVFKTSKM